jgi:DNA polymerase III subunit delta
MSSVCVVGTEASMVYDALHRRVEEALEGLNESALQVFTAKDVTTSAEPIVAGVLEALNTPGLLAERRVVVVRDAQLLLAEEVALLVAWMQAGASDADLLVAVVGAKSHKLVKAAQQVIEVNVGTRLEDRASFVADTLGAYGVGLTLADARRVAELVGDDVARIDALARTLQSIFGSRALTFDDLAPYLGDAGDVPEWDLTDAIDAGDATRALEVARRMLDSRSRVGLQIVNLLQRYYLRLARLEGSGARTPDDAAALLGIKAYPAGKALRSATRLGAARVAAALSLIARADEDLKGGVDYGRDPESDADVTDATVIEVLVARLARMARR